VACIFSICATLRTDELTKITVNDIEKQGNLLLVKIRDSKNHDSRSFVIMGSLVDVVKRYWAMRPPTMVNTRFFVNYRSGKCTSQVVGKIKLGKMPERIATYLHLPNPKTFTGEFSFTVKF